ncbi:MAG: hypothetical protein KJO56_04885 [Gammaproteobacteria bacterium]|nr:hypothetical protein [Gammaproteobacteria bacterium]MBT8106229.1 hypothetical protein [Gammaproteobacteria bacterium]NNK26243.1 hypothetical protein [Woeseiaceae bacterium]
MSDKKKPALNIIRKETALFLVLLLFGLVVLPMCIWFTGQIVFGAYGGTDYGEFFGALNMRIRSLDPFAWFLVLSPWLVCQVARLMRLGWRAVGKL